MQETGNVVSVHGSSRSMYVVMLGLALIFACAGAFLLCILINPGSMHFTGDKSVALGVGWGCIVAGILIALGSVFAMRRQPRFTLFEHAIQARSGRGTRTDPYDEIVDIFHFPYGGIGYRSGNGEWVFSGGRTSRPGVMAQKLTDLQISHRLPVLIQQLQRGESVTFRHFPAEFAASKALVATRNLDCPTQDIRVNLENLFVEGRTLPIDQIAALKTSAWSERVKILDASGEVLFQTHASAILSPHLLHALLVWIQDQQASAQNS